MFILYYHFSLYCYFNSPPLSRASHPNFHIHNSDHSFFFPRSCILSIHHPRPGHPHKATHHDLLSILSHLFQDIHPFLSQLWILPSTLLSAKIMWTLFLKQVPSSHQLYDPFSLSLAHLEPDCGAQQLPWVCVSALSRPGHKHCDHRQSHYQCACHLPFSLHLPWPCLILVKFLRNLDFHSTEPFFFLYHADISLL